MNDRRVNADTLSPVKWILPAAASAGGFAACLLRLLQNRTGFEADTGLPVRGYVPAIALAVLLGGLTLLFFLLSRTLTGEREPLFPFYTESRMFFILPTAGSLFLALGGGADLLESMEPRGVPSDSFVTATLLNRDFTSIPQGIQLLLGILTLLTAGCLMLSCAACRKREWRERQLRRHLFRREILLVPSLTLLLRMVMIYRMDSIDPLLAKYVPELMALFFLTAGFFSLSASAFGEGRLSTLSFTAGCSVLFSLCALTDEWKYLSSPLVLLGGSLSLMGFLLLRLQAPLPPDESADTPEA